MPSTIKTGWRTQTKTFSLDSVLQAATILAPMVSEKKNWQQKFWQKSPTGNHQIKRETYLKNYQ